MSHQICEGLTVVTLGSGPACDIPAMVMADNGARVIKVERPGGDSLRSAMPSASLVWNRGKESLVADLSTDEGRAEVLRYVDGADVVIDALGALNTARFGLGAGALRARNPRLVHCTVTAFGATSPYARLKGYEGIVAAKAGGYPPARFRPGPSFFGMPRASIGAAHHALQGIAAALVVREQTGRGQALEVSLLGGLTTYDYFGLPVYQLMARHPERYAGRGHVSAPGGLLCSADGRWVLPTNRLRKEYEALVRAVELEYVWDDPRLRLRSGPGEAPRTASPEDDAALWDLIRVTFHQRPLEEWLPRMAAEDDVAAEWARTCEQALDHPQVLHNGHVVEVDDPRVGRMRQVGPIALFTETPSQIGAPAPDVGVHGDAPHPTAGSTSTAAPPDHPLSGVTVIELGHHYAMPYAITLVAALGARVIKVEPPAGDHQRDLVPIPEAGGHKVMDGKESVIADVTTPEGREIVYELARRADVFALGLRQPAADRMAMDAATIRAINPDIVYFTANGYGESGPFVGKAMHAGTASAAVGSLHHQAPTWLDPALADGKTIDELEDLASRFGSGAHNGDAASAASAASALVLAILAKKRFGTAQYVRTTMLIGNAYSYSDDFNSYAGKPPTRLADPEQLGLSPLYRLYATAAGWVFLAAPGQDDWEALCAAGGSPLGADPLFQSVGDRETNADALSNALAALFATKTAEEWERLLVPQGVGCVAVFEGTMAEFAATDPVVRQTGHVVEVDHPIFGLFLRHGLPQAFSETPGYLGTGCWAGQHTVAVLTELGYTPDQVHELELRGITASRRTKPAM